MSNKVTAHFKDNIMQLTKGDQIEFYYRDGNVWIAMLNMKPVGQATHVFLNKIMAIGKSKKQFK